MRASAIGIACVIAALLAAGCAAPEAAGPGAAVRGPAPGAEAGIEVTAVRISAAGRVVDLRYRVVDPERARTVLGRDHAPYAIDQATGVRLTVPRAGKVGALRQTAQQAEQGRVYFILFGNTGGVVRPGSRLTVVLGDVRIADLTVE